MNTDHPTGSEWRGLTARGVYDPDATDAARRRQALQLLLDRGATVDDLVANRDDLGAFAAHLALGGTWTTTRREIAERAGVSLESLQRLSLATGLPDPGPDVMSGTDADVALVEVFRLGAALFGEETAYQLARVIGGSAGKMADAVVSAFAADIAPTVADDPSGLSLIERNLELADLMPTFMAWFEQLFRRHVINASRPQLASSARGYESQRLVVGFVDLVGSTELAGRLSAPELGAALSVFEATAADIVVSHRGRVVKLIGDEIMFAAPRVDDGCTIAHEIVIAFAEHPVLPPVRAGLAYGDVLTRDGDCFGPTVNLAAPITSQAAACEILTSVETASEVSASTWAVTQIGTRTLKGIGEAVALARLARL